MIHSVQQQSVLLKDLYVVLGNLATDIQDLVDKNKLDVKDLSIDYSKGIFRILVNTHDNRSIVQMLKK